MKNKKLLVLAVTLLFAVPSIAVFNEKNISQTIAVLRSELHQENQKMENAKSMLSKNDQRQHRKMISMIKRCNELSLMLYSQNQDYTFDMTYALEEVSKQYEKFGVERLPFDAILTRLNFEIDRYERLIESLRRLPPVLDEIEVVPDSLSISKDSLMLELRPSAKPAGGHTPRDTSRRSTFILDQQGRIDRDSCIAYAMNLLKMYTDTRDEIIEDNSHYDNLHSRLKESYDYAQQRYSMIQKRIFVEGQDNYFKVLGSLKTFIRSASREAKAKYSLGNGIGEQASFRHSEWRGPVVSGFIIFVIVHLLLAFLLSTLIINLLSKKVAKLKTDNFRKRKSTVILLFGVVLFAISIMAVGNFIGQNFFKVASGALLVYAWLLGGILLSLLIRIPAEKLKVSTSVYTPTVLLGLVVIVFRIIFIPNRLLNLIYPPLLLAFTIWQICISSKSRKKIEKTDFLLSTISIVILGMTTISAWAGYVLLSVQLFLWWLFQLAAIESITALSILVRMYGKNVIVKRTEEYQKDHIIVDKSNKQSYIEVTWLYGFVREVAIPVLGILSLPFCIRMAADVFDLSAACKTIFFKPFLNLTDASGNPVLNLSLYKFLLILSLFFLFRYLSYTIKAFYRHLRYEKIMATNGKGYVQANEVNLTLANNVIAILVWGTYVAIAIILLKIPMGALSIVAAGLATGIGLALKDVLNNFIYGIQLMSGRVRVGDYIECDGVRGKVESITYQSTQIITLEGSVMAFTNSTLFNKNFKNLTKGNAYEYVKIPVGISYGADIDKVREILSDALQTLMTKDRYNRNIVDPKRGINVVFNSFGDSGVEIAVKQYVLVEEEPGYIARAKELIYKTLNNNGIEIPFPQRDIHIKQ